jgi:hypothetical protein
MQSPPPTVGLRLGLKHQAETLGTDDRGADLDRGGLQIQSRVGDGNGFTDAKRCSVPTSGPTRLAPTGSWALGTRATIMRVLTAFYHQPLTPPELSGLRSAGPTFGGRTPIVLRRPGNA